MSATGYHAVPQTQVRRRGHSSLLGNEPGAEVTTGYDFEPDVGHFGAHDDISMRFALPWPEQRVDERTSGWLDRWSTGFGVGSADQSHMARLIDAMRASQAISDNRGYNHIAGFHGAPGFYCWHHQRSRLTSVRAQIFLPWHRAYMWWLEQALQDRVAQTALPWWDWTRTTQIPDAYAAERVPEKGVTPFGDTAWWSHSTT